MSELLKATQEMMDAYQAEMLATITAGHEETIAKMAARLKEMEDGPNEMKASRGTEACLDSKSPNADEMQSRVERWEVPKKHATVKPARGVKKRHRGQRPAVGRAASRRNGPREMVVSGGRWPPTAG
jgi:hypothetical protein